MTSPLSPEAVAQMVADLRAADKPLIQSGPFIQTRERLRSAADMLTTLAAENATLRAELREDAMQYLASIGQAQEALVLARGCMTALIKALRPFADIGVPTTPDYSPEIRLDRDAILAARAAIDLAAKVMA